MKFSLKNLFPGFLIILLVWPSGNLKASITITSNNPFLRVKDCSGVTLNDTTIYSGMREINYGDGTGLFTVNYGEYSHQYINEGTFIIKYFKHISSGSGVDSFIDTVQVALTTTALFNYKTNSQSHIYGIKQFNFLNINKVITEVGRGQLVYSDYTCSDQSFIDEGVVYTASAITDSIYKGFIYVFLDANNDGRFQKTEIAGESENFINHSFGITIPNIEDSLVGVPLRLRVVCTDGRIPFLNPGSGFWYSASSIQDYSVILANTNSNPPSASFKAYHYCDGLYVQFLNTSSGAPDSVRWHFPNGIDSTTFAPAFTFNTKCDQEVDLIAYNGFGTDSIRVKLNNPSCPDIIRDDPALPNQTITFHSPEIPKALSWRWTFPEGPLQSFDSTATNIYFTEGAFPFSLTTTYRFADFYSDLHTCITTTDDTVFIVSNSADDYGNFNGLNITSNKDEASINIFSNDFGKITMHTIDIAGRIENEFIFTKSTTDFSCNISFRNSGIYLLVIQMNENKISRKILSIK